MFIAKLFVYICEKSYPLNSYHTMHMCQQLQQQQKQKQQPTEVKLFTQWKKHVFFNTQINTYGCVHDCVCVSFSHIYFILTLYCVIKNKLRIQGDRQKWRETMNALQYEFRLRNLRLYLQKQPKDERQSRRTVPHGHLLNYSLRHRWERGVLQSQVSPSLKLDWLYRKLSGPKQISVAEGKLSHPTCRLFFYVSKRKFATVFRILFV